MAKTKTSTAVKQRYNAKAYKQVKFDLPPSLVEEFKELCEMQNTSMRSVIIELISDYILASKH